MRARFAHPPMPFALDSLPSPLGARTRQVVGREPRSGPFVLYWMRTAVRGWENPALDVALAAGNALGVPVFVYHAVSERYRYASDRHHTFILEGARDVAEQLADRGVGYAFHVERPGHRGPHLRHLGERAALVVTEEMPVHPMRLWTRRLAEAIEAPVWSVDTLAVVPMREMGGGITRAFTYRTRMASLLERHLEPWEDVTPAGPPTLPPLPFRPIDWTRDRIPDLVAECEIDHSIGPVPDTPGGSAAGYARWTRFRDERLRAYARERNDPLRHGVSRMSAYLHYGMVAPTRLAREARAVGGKGAEKYLDELLVWRELPSTWCLYNAEHDSLDALPDWARETLLAHRDDPRQVLGREQLERGRTGDALWDAAQRSLLTHGELHNNVRMTWAKAILGWTEGPEEALAAMIDLNHRYALDGRDPASYGGLLWALGQFDRPFPPERPILGTVRPRDVAAHAERLDIDAFARWTQRPLVARPPRVAVIGGGPAGALCARTLTDHRVPVVVFDKARGPGGRLSTRRAGDARFDHGAQFITCRDPVMRRRVEQWVEAGVLARWEGPFVDLGPDGIATRAAAETRLVGAPSMNALIKHLLRDVDARFGHRVDAVERVDGAWKIVFDGGDAEIFDVVIVATPAPQALPLLSDAPALRARAAEVVIAPCWALMLALPTPLDVGWAAADVDDPVVAWIARNHTKPGRTDREQLVAHATAAWSEAHLEATPEEVAERLRPATARVLGTSLSPSLVQAHRWRFARVTTPAGTPCLWDPRGLGVCGDGMLGGRVEAALRSGAAMAGRVLGSLEAEPTAAPSLFDLRRPVGATRPV